MRRLPCLIAAGVAASPAAAWAAGALDGPVTKQATNVTAIALEYGFTHLGRFSEFYKTAFGMLPSESLRERNGRA